MYLKSRLPLPLNFNPYISWNDTTNPKHMSQDMRATILIVETLKFLNSTKTQSMKPDLYILDEKKTNVDKFLRMAKYIPSPLRYR